MAQRPKRSAGGPARRPVAWLRRRPLPAAARLLTLGAAVLVALWIVGHALTDRFHATQYLYWLPTFAVLALGWPMVVVARFLEKLSSRLAGFRLRPLVTAALFVITVLACVRFWHIHRYLLSPGGGLRVVYWNLAVDPAADHAGRAVLWQKPDIAVVANPRWGAQRSALLESLAALDPLDPDPAAVHVLFRSEIAVATTGRLTRYGRVSFDMGSDDPEDRGVVLFVEIEGLATEPTVVWVVDLPSRPSLWRAAVTAAARAAVDAFTGPVSTADEQGRWTASEAPGRFPPADIVVGDFNIPRGSHSLEALAAGLAESHAAAGRGLAKTWPRELPVLAIDLLFTRYGVGSHRVLDPGSGRHRMVVVDLHAP